MPNVLDGINLFHITTEPIVSVSVNLMGMEPVRVIGPLRVIHSKRLHHKCYVDGQKWGCNPFCLSQCPNITHLSPINYIITHMTMHFFFLIFEICKYQGHPYTIIKCLNIVRISQFYNIFLQYYFSTLFLYF